MPPKRPSNLFSHSFPEFPRHTASYLYLRIPLDKSAPQTARFRAKAVAAALLGRAPSGTPDDFRMVYHLGQGYAIPNPEDTPYIQELARMEGILLDPVYTGKAWSGMLRLLEAGGFPGQEDILFLHTGGAAALFAMDLA